MQRKVVVLEWRKTTALYIERVFLMSLARQKHEGTKLVGIVFLNTEIKVSIPQKTFLRW